MGPKRRSSRGAAGGRRKRQATQKASSKTPKSDNKDTSDSQKKATANDVNVLYKTCVQQGTTRERQFAIAKSVERGDLQNVVFPYLQEGSFSKEACLLVALLVSTACREGSFAAFATEWNQTNDKVFKGVLDTLLSQDIAQVVSNLKDQDEFWYKSAIVHFCIVCLAHAMTFTTGNVHTALLNHISGLNIWQSMPQGRLELELKKSSGGIRRQYATLTQTEKPIWIVSCIHHVLYLLKVHKDTKQEQVETVNESDEEEEEQQQEEEAQENQQVAPPTAMWNFLHRCLELLIDLLSIQSTRCYLVTFLESIHFTIHCRRARVHNTLFQQLLKRIEVLLQFPMDTSGQGISKPNMVAIYHGRATTLQKMCHRYYTDQVPDIVHASVGILCAPNSSYLVRALNGLTHDQVLDLLHKLRLVDKQQVDDASGEFCMDIIQRHVTIPPHPLDELETFPLYPTESVLWDFHVVPPGKHGFTRNDYDSMVLSLPKLNTQFLTFDDYLLRNFELTRLSSAYEIRSDLVHAISRVRPVLRQRVSAQDDEEEENLVARTEFDGWARMALELTGNVEFTKVALPKLGQNVPAQVIADVQIDLLHCGQSIRGEWDALSEFDVLFLVGIDASQATGGEAMIVKEEHGQAREWRVPPEDDVDFPQRHGVMAVRGCMVLHVRDEDGTILSDPAQKYQASEKIEAKGTKRILRVEMDAAQFAKDARSKIGLRVYDTLNLVVRRHGRENNFKAQLETIRGLMQGSGSIHRVLPPWLQPLLLGVGDAHAASYKSETMQAYATKTTGVTNPDAALDYGDTFLDEAHLRSSFGDNCKVTVDGRKKAKSKKDSKERQNYRVRILEEKSGESPTQLVEATTYPFPTGVNGNPVRFTPVQVEAVRSGLSPGLTLVVGPPGTGKTDVAVQIIANLYHSFPTQRTVIVTHSNAALNDLFEKVVARGDVDERYMIRLGSGERDLKIESTHDFTRAGRVAQSLAKRALLLEQVQLLSESLGISGRAERGADGSPSYTCETAEYFQRYQVQKRIQVFDAKLKDTQEGESDVFSAFPFKKYFGLEDEQSQDGESMPIEQAREKFSRLKDIFEELAEYRPLEMLRSLRQRTDYLLMKQAKIVAMTCTHAAIARNHLIELGFQYDNVIMEEAAQMMEVETFIPLLLQRGESSSRSSDSSNVAQSRLKRVGLIGDHQQLPPVIKNQSFSNFSNLDQSLFARLIRLGFPYIELNRQGRAREDLARLYSWRYKDLGNLPHVLESPSFQVANTGFAHTYQLITVDKYQGRGETTPTAYFYQNVGEAEYMVALFQFMVLIGYPSERISLLTTYNGQKELLSDILEQRCGQGTPFAGIRPGAVSTVDRYQGQQNDFILLSLVRTEAVGHLRDVRRLVVAVSRARLGLYVFCRQDVFANCHELKATMDQLTQRPGKLQLVLNEHYPTDRKLADDVAKKDVFEVDDVAHLGSIVHSMQEDWMAPEPETTGE